MCSSDLGVRDTAHLRELQAARLAETGRLRHRTRNFPRRREEILDGGSMYWVIGGSMLARQPVTDIVEDAWDDGSACAGLVLDPTLIPLEGRPTKPFQGWRYLAASDAPADRASFVKILGLDTLPPAMRRELQALCLI